MSTIKVNRLESTSTANGGIDIDTDGHVQFDGLQLPTDGALSNRNLIINGDMVHDQRSNGSVFATSGDTYGTCDRWSLQYSNNSRFTGQQVSDGPVGFDKSLKAEVTSYFTVSSDKYFIVEQAIEGYNTSSLSWGSSNAKAISISFWVKASVTGTYSIALRNSDFTRSRVEEYTINTANTWEYKTITTPGDTTGTYNTTNGVGIRLVFDLGVGSDFEETAGTWVAGNKFSTSNSVRLIETQDATWQITGVQLEVGSKATPFEHESYGQTLAKCQRYFQKSYEINVVPGTVHTAPSGLITHYGSTDNSGNIVFQTDFRCEMRTVPTIIFYANDGSQGTVYTARSGSSGNTTGHTYRRSTRGTCGYGRAGTTAASYVVAYVEAHYTASAEL
jgi:hypothetical protein